MIAAYRFIAFTGTRKSLKNDNEMRKAVSANRVGSRFVLIRQ